MPDQGRTPEYKKRATKKYLSKFKEIRIRVLPDEHQAIIAHAKAAGDRSTVAFVSRAIHEAMERDKKRLKKKEKE